jgi:hypothetical protein
MARGCGGLQAPARAGDAVPRLLRRAAVHAGVLDAVGVAARGRHRARHDRHAVVGRYHLFDQVLLGAGGGPPAAAAARAAARPAAQLDAGRAGGHRDRPLQHGSLEPRGAPRRHGRARAARGVLLGHAGRRHRRLAHRGLAAVHAGRDGGGVPARLSHRDHGGQRRGAVDRRGLRLDGGVHGHGRHGGRGHRHDARHLRARAAGGAADPGAGAARHRLAGAQGALAGHDAAGGVVVRGRGGLPVRGLLHALRQGGSRC